MRIPRKLKKICKKLSSKTTGTKPKDIRIESVNRSEKGFFYIDLKNI
jgi:hypothetical protein